MKLSFYTGGYTTGAKRGITYYKWDDGTDRLEKREFLGMENPSCILLHPNKQVLYAVNETDCGKLQSYAVEPSGALFLTGELPSYGDAPCHLAMPEDGSMLAVSNYMSGSIAFYALDASGAIGSLLCRHQFYGSGNLKRRQATQHTHSACFANGYCYICELGCDSIYQVSVERLRSGNVTDADFESVHDFTENGNVTGVRLGCFTADGKYYFVGGELDNRIHCFDADGMRYQSSVETAPVKEQNTFAHLVLSADEKKIYGSVRGENTVVSLDVADGALSNLRIFDCGGVGPRYFALAEGYLLCANQRSDNIVIFQITAEGGLEKIREIKEAAPTAIVMR